MYKNWSESEVDFLIENYPYYGAQYCVKELNRSYNSVSRKVQKIGLTVDKEICNTLKKEGILKSGKSRKKDRIGEKFKTYQGYEVEIIEYFNCQNSTVKFNDERGTTRKKVTIKELKSGSVKNLFRPDILGVGFYGEGIHKAKINGQMTKCYTTWFNILNRCYGSPSVNNRAKTYFDVFVCKEWHNYQVFAQWFIENYDFQTMNNTWNIDKDILCPTCKIYSPETCIFIPNEVNVVFKKNNESVVGLPKGVYPKDGKYQSSISRFGKQYYLGFFNTIEEAHNIYVKNKKEYLVEVSKKWRGILSDRICDAIESFDINLL